MGGDGGTGGAGAPGSLGVIATVAVGQRSTTRGVAVDATGGSVYVTNQLGNTVSVIDAATNTVTATWTGAGDLSRPSGIAISAPMAASGSPTTQPRAR